MQQDEFEVPRLENIEELPALLASYENMIKLTMHQTEQNEELRAMIKDHCERYNNEHKLEEADAHEKIDGLATDYSSEFKTGIEKIQDKILEDLDDIQQQLNKVNSGLHKFIAVIGALATGLVLALGGLVKEIFF